MQPLSNRIGLSHLNQVLSRKLIDTIETLPTENRKVIDLHFRRNISRKKIAAELGWSLSKVNTKITRGLTLLKYQLNPDYFTEMNKLIDGNIIAAGDNDSGHFQNKCGKQ